MPERARQAISKRKASDIEALNKIENIHAVRLDVTVQGEIDAAVESIRSEGKGLWGLVNNAGVNVVGPLIEFDDEDFDFLFDVNVRGVFSVTKAFAPMIIEDYRVPGPNREHQLCLRYRNGFGIRPLQHDQACD
jgi:NAD(P)-dependent dehydrogenase (short-subunit alcohol dehydrogenase family)